MATKPIMLHHNITTKLTKNLIKLNDKRIKLLDHCILNTSV